MSIIDSFDIKSPAVINLEDVCPKSSTAIDVCIINFSYKVMDALLKQNLLEELDTPIKSVSCEYPVYRYKNTNIGVIKTTVGAPVAAVLLEEVGFVYSCKKFVMFGSCGGLDKSISPNKLIVPTHAYRDEGMSYHYAPPSDYITVKNSQEVGCILSKIGVEFVYGKTWTTDAFYRETKNNMEKRKKEGCIAVEMEVSACQAVADFRGIEFYNFLYRADNLDSSKWQRDLLGLITLDDRLKNFAVALEIAKNVI